jgi:Uma2 family endonuclease
MENTILTAPVLPRTLHKSDVRKKSSAKKPVTVDDFEKWLQLRKRDNNYEFYYGEIIKKPAMKQDEFYIANLLIRLFFQTKAFIEGGMLFSECDTYIDSFRKRVPDLAFFTKQQIEEGRKGVKIVPSFAIEILSHSEAADDVEQKIQDYFDAGVQIVWYISPKGKRIYVYTAPTEVKIYHGTMVCTAQPALPDFEIVVSDLFEEK